jgi:hypothetical protein
LSLFCHRPRQPARASPASSLLSGHISRASSRQPRNVSTVLPPCFSSFSSLALRTSFLYFDFPQLALSASASPALSIRLATRQPNAKKPTNSSEDVPAALLHQERQGRGRVSSLKFEKQELSACDQQASLLITAISSLFDGTSASLGRSTWRRSIKKHGSTARQRLQDSSASDEGDQRLRPLYTGIRASSKPLFKVRLHIVSFRQQNHCVAHLYFHCFPSAEPRALLASARRPPLSSDILLWLLNPSEVPDACRHHSRRVRSPFDGYSGDGSTKSTPARALPRSVRRCRRHGNEEALRLRQGRRQASGVLYSPNGHPRVQRPPL